MSTSKSDVGGQDIGAISLSAEIVTRIEVLLEDAEQTSRPLEVDPYREQLFELFVTAEGAGLLVEGVEEGLTSDAISHRLAQRWDLATAAQASVERQERLSEESLGRMRMLWSFLRMWMEWTYAWDRWSEFHDTDSPSA